ncbi:MAG: DMT family transporter [Deltaproteobacteria bacterium]|nr:DMT family transporter [Deltaproteobacteria bacterium]
MLPITLSIFACFGWGIADFIGGLKSRSLPTLSILMISSLMGTFLLGIIILSLNSPLPDDPLLLWAIPAGIIGVIAMFLLYRSLAVGTMSILAPISATGVILPVIWGIISGDTLSGLCSLGIAIAILGSLMAVMENDPKRKKRKLTRGVGLAVGSAFFVGLYFITMDTACTHHPIWASMIMRSSTLIILIPLLFFAKITIRIGKVQFPPLLLMGVMDTMAAFCFAVATSKGMLSQVAVISSLYPAVTIILSAVITGERIQKIQFSGVILAIAGITLISAF